MKNRLTVLLILVTSFFASRYSYPQASPADTVLIKRYLELSAKFEKNSQFDSSFYYSEKSLQLNTKYYGERNLKNADILHFLGRLLVKKNKFDQALDYYNKSLEIRLELEGEKGDDVALSCIDIGTLHYYTGSYDKCMEYYFKALDIKLKLMGEKNADVATTYNNIGLVFARKGEYDKALEYDLKALEIRKEVLGEKHRDLAASYSSVGNVYLDKGETDKSLEYLLKALQIRRDVLGENSYYVANDYSNIGNVYQDKGDDINAIDHYLKALKIYTAVLGDKHYYVALCNMNLGISYLNLNEYEKALDHDLKALDVLKQIYGEIHPHVATCCVNISDAYYKLRDYDQSLAYQIKALQIYKEIFGEKHPFITASYNNLGSISTDKKDYEGALKYFQKGIAGCLSNFNDTADIYKIPPIKNYLDWNYLLQSLLYKANIIGDRTKYLSVLDWNVRKKSAIDHYLACDTLIDIVRHEITTPSDKLALGEKANEVYRKAIDLLIPFISDEDRYVLTRIPEEDKNLAFYFSEKSKASVLLEAIAGQKAMKYAGIDDSMIQKEELLEKEKAELRKTLAEQNNLDSAQKELYLDKLFNANRSADSLISVFEKEYPSYYNLKYNNEPASVKDIQDLLDKRSAMLSYFTGDTTITIFRLTGKSLDVVRVARPSGLNDSIEFYRNGLTLGIPGIILNFGRKLYKQVFPGCLPVSSQIKNLIIIPDGSLSMLPFESLVSENFRGDINKLSSYPYLIKKYNICYVYSGNLFYQQFSDKNSSGKEEPIINEWLGFAPVFNTAEFSIARAGSEMQDQLKEMEKDSVMAENAIFRGGSIKPLPATETEVGSIYKLYKDNNLKANLVLHKNANEKFLKSEDLSDYKILHIATHGFVNSGKPELSGLLLAQDTTGGEDGILYTGEIYNLKLNADLVVLSACETGLGKIQKGEGVMGLTRSLLFAGARNIIVSLWPVNDYSTNDLMLDLYRNILSSRGNRSYSQALRKAKLKMISGGKYSSPFYWSPFILIGS